MTRDGWKTALLVILVFGIVIQSVHLTITTGKLGRANGKLDVITGQLCQQKK